MMIIIIMLMLMMMVATPGRVRALIRVLSRRPPPGAAGQGDPPGSPRASEAENEPDEIPGPIRPGGPRGGAAAGAGSRVGAPKCTFAHILLYSTLAAPGTRKHKPGKKPWNCVRVWILAREAVGATQNTI